MINFSFGFFFVASCRVERPFLAYETGVQPLHLGAMFLRFLSFSYCKFLINKFNSLDCKITKNFSIDKTINNLRGQREFNPYYHDFADRAS